MKKTVLALGIGMALGAAGVAIAGRPADDDTSVTLRLRNITPSSFVKTLASSNEGRLSSLLPEGITQINPDDPRGRLTIRGDRESIDRVQMIVNLLDQPQKGVRLPVRIWRMDGSPALANPPRRLVATAVAQTVNNRPEEVTAIGDGHVFQIRLLPHVNGDQSMTLAAGFGTTPIGAPLAKFADIGLSTKIIQPGTTAIFSAPSIPARSGTDEAISLTPAEPKFGYVIEVMPETLLPSNIRVPLR